LAEAANNRTKKAPGRLFRVDFVFDDFNTETFIESSKSIFWFTHLAIQPFFVEPPGSVDSIFVAAVSETGKSFVEKIAIPIKQQAALENSDNH